jgi:Leucine-rich repeat (LRR) protein
MQLFAIALIWRTAESALSRPHLRQLRMPKTNQELEELVAANPETTELDLSGSPDISDITALASLSRLQKLDISHTSVEDLSVLNQLHELEDLTASSTPVTELHLADLTRLTRVILTGSQIRFLSLANLPELRVLDCGFTPLSSLSHLSGLPKLRKLELSLRLSLSI